MSILTLNIGTQTQFDTAKGASQLQPNSFYIVDGKPHLSLSSSTEFAFIDAATVSQMIAGLGDGGGGSIGLGTMAGRPPSVSGAVGTSPLAAHEDHDHPAQVNISGSAATADHAATAGSAQTAVAANSAETATKLATSRTFRLTGAVTGSAIFDGSSDCSIATTLATVSSGPDHWFGSEMELPVVRDADTIYFVYE